MRTNAVRLRTSLLCCAAVAAALLAAPAEARAQTDRKKRDADYARYVKQLAARFIAWDADADNNLDKTELAKAFRGPDARPFDAGADVTVSDSDRGRMQSLYTALLAMPLTSGLPVNQTLMGVVDLRAPRNFGPNPGYMLYPDYQFLVLAGTRGQTSLTKAEFDTWARSYAGTLADAASAQRRYQAAQTKFQKAKTKKAKQAAQTEVARAQQDYQTAQAVLTAIPAAIHQALGLKQ
jgi:hypothetical protein